LPFHVYFKIAVAFLGKDEIVNFSILRQGHLVSCWTKLIENSRNSTVSIKKNITNTSYLGISFGYL
jgi:hypothetical protein